GDSLYRAARHGSGLGCNLRRNAFHHTGAANSRESGFYSIARDSQGAAVPEGTVAMQARSTGILACVGFLLICAACYALASAVKIDPFFCAVDLGRPPKNGGLLLSSTTPPRPTSKILHKNFYSYAIPDAEFINHHWLSGVLYYLVWKRVGFAGLNAVYVLLGVAAFLMSWRIAERAAGWEIATATALPMMPI